MKMLQQGFTLIELMIVVAIIGILAAVAIPSYQDYTARAQVTEAVSLTAAFKTGLAEYQQTKGSFPANLTNVGSTTSGKYVGSMILGTDVAVGTAATISAVMKSQGVNAGIKGSTLMLVTGDSGQQWTCTAGTILAKYRPGTCK